jgi:hypothetical protein
VAAANAVAAISNATDLVSDPSTRPSLRDGPHARVRDDRRAHIPMICIFLGPVTRRDFLMTLSQRFPLRRCHIRRKLGTLTPSAGLSIKLGKVGAAISGGLDVQNLPVAMIHRCIGNPRSLLAGLALAAVLVSGVA